MARPFTATDALILREVRYKEADRILTVLTSSSGLMTVKAQGALRKQSRLAASTQQLTYSEVVFFENRGYSTVKEAAVKEDFAGLRANFENFSLGCYFAECIEALLPENTPEPSVMQLALNSLYALSREMYSPEKIKAVFEMRLMSILGYTPDLGGCCVCGRAEPVSPVLCYETGHVCCRECRNASTGLTDYLCTASLEALKHIVNSPAKQILSFDIDDEALTRLGRACEHYLLRHADRGFGTLDYWKNVRRSAQNFKNSNE